MTGSSMFAPANTIDMTVTVSAGNVHAVFAIQGKNYHGDFALGPEGNLSYVGL
jgi:hypothetical protein